VRCTGSSGTRGLTTVCSFTVCRRAFGCERLLTELPADSGHGEQTKDLDGDEKDGLDEGEYRHPPHTMSCHAL
jgi:hypothetical protein